MTANALYVGEYNYKDKYKIIVHRADYEGAQSYTYDIYKIEKASQTYYASTAYNLRPIIANWYNILRDISIVAMLSILVYVGIRIMISSTAGDKAKYKQLLIDWVVAVCLLFSMQYIMSFSNMLVKRITAVIQSGVVSVTSGDKLSEKERKAAESNGNSIDDKNGVAITRGTQLFTIDETDLVKKAYEILVTNNTTDTDYSSLFSDGESGVLYWPTNNFTEQARMLGQLTDEDENATNYEYASIGYKIIYFVLVMYTLIFTWTYVKRVVYMAFLTMIAPLVAMTYPIDKMNDGKAQAFNMWFKEYIFNLLIQPLHLILYMVLIGSAMQFASQNLIYAVVALGFMTPAEKLLRKFFGFEKAQTPGMFAGPAGTALMMGGMNRLLGKPPHPPKGGGKGGSSDEEEDLKGTNSLRFKEDVETGSVYNTDNDYLRDDKQEKVPEIGFGNENANDNANVNSLAAEERENKKKAFGVITGGKLDDGTANGNSVNGNRYNGDNKSMNNSTNNLQISQNSIPKNNKGKEKKKISRKSIGRGLERAGQKFVRKNSEKQPIRKMARIGTGLAAAALTTTAAGLFSMTDPEHAGRNMATAAVAGYNVGKVAPDAVMKKVENGSEYVQAFKEGVDPEGYAQKQIEKNIKRRSNDLKYREEVRQRLDKLGMTDVSFDEYYEKYGQYAVRKGQSSAAEGVAGYALMEEEGYSKESATQFVKLSKNEEKDTSKYDDEKSQNLNKTIRNSVVRGNRNKNLTNEQIDRQVDKVRNSYDKASKYLYMKI